MTDTVNMTDFGLEAAFTKTWVAAWHQSESLPWCHETNVAAVVRRCCLRNRCRRRRRGHVFVVAAGAAAKTPTIFRPLVEYKVLSGAELLPVVTWVVLAMSFLAMSVSVTWSRDVISRVFSRPLNATRESSVKPQPPSILFLWQSEPEKWKWIHFEASWRSNTVRSKREKFYDYWD